MPNSENCPFPAALFSSNVNTAARYISESGRPSVNVLLGADSANFRVRCCRRDVTLRPRPVLWSQWRLKNNKSFWLVATGATVFGWFRRSMDWPTLCVCQRAEPLPVYWAPELAQRHGTSHSACLQTLLQDLAPEDSCHLILNYSLILVKGTFVNNSV